MLSLHRSALPVAALLLLAAGARAQCQEWAAGFQLDGIDGVVKVLAVIDLGSGPELYAGGTFQRAGVVAASNIARWDGTRWWPLSSGTNGVVNCLKAFDDGTGTKLYAGGGFSQAGGTNMASVAEWDGTTWSVPSTTQAPNGIVEALAVFDEGSGPRLFAAGSFVSVFGTTNARRIARFDGSTWSPVGFGANGTVRDLAVYDDGSGAKLYATGSFDTVGTNFHGDTAASFLARWTGTAWETSFGGLQSAGITLDVLDDGMGSALFVGGAFSAAGGQPADRVARYSPAGWTGVGFGLNGAPEDFEVFDDGTGPALYACGFFSNAGNFAKYVPGLNWTAVGGGAAGAYSMVPWAHAGVPKLWLGTQRSSAGSVSAHGVLLWDGTEYSLVDPAQGIDASAARTAVHDDGSGPALYLGASYWAGAGGLNVPEGSTVRWDGTSWSIVGSPSATGFLLSVPDGPLAGLYALGRPSGSTGPAFQVWDGSTWTALSTASIPSLNVVTGAAYGAVLGAPAIVMANSQSTYYWDGTTWTELLAQHPDVLSFVTFDDGTGPALYMGGSTTQVFKLVGTFWTPYSNLVAGTVRELLVFDDGSGPAIFVRGVLQIGGLQNIAKIVGTTLTAIPGGAAYELDDFCVFDDGSGPAIHAIANFNTFPGNASQDFRLTSTGWVPATSRVNERATLMETMVDPGGDSAHLFLFGDFDLADGQPSHRVARWDVCLGTGADFCFGDGTGTACPCANASPVGEHRGCANSLGAGGRIAASGSASLANDTVVLSGSGMPNSSALYFQGTVQQSGGLGLVFGDGLRCAGGSSVRLGTKTNSAGASQFPAAGDASVSVRGQVMSPGSRTYQIWYRNAASFCTSSTFNFTNGTQIQWTL